LFKSYISYLVWVIENSGNRVCGQPEFFLIYPKFSRYFITSWISPPPIQFPNVIREKKPPAGEETQGNEIAIKSPSGVAFPRVAYPEFPN